MKTLIAFAAAAFLCGTSSASVVIDFSNVPVGASVAEFYNGGRDSTGAQSGVNYGISFSGGSIRNTVENGAYLFGGTTITFNAPPAGAGNGFTAYFLSNVDAYNGVIRSYDRSGQIIGDSYISGNRNAYCDSQGAFTKEACQALTNAYTGDIFFSSRVEFQANTYRVDFGQISIDRFTIGADPRLVNSLMTEVPEPASLALVGLGLVGLIAARRHVLKSK